MNARVAPNTLVTMPDADAQVTLGELSAHIVAELAAGLSDAPTIRQRYGISEKQWKTLSKSPTFRNMLAEAVRTFQGDLNAGTRITKKAEIVLEDAIPAYDGIIHNKDIPAQQRIEAGKLLASLAGRTQRDGVTATPGAGFQLNINIGSREKLVIDGKNLPIPVETEQ